MPHHTSDTTCVKTCSQCLIAQPATTQYFFRSAKSADGLTTECKTCRKQRQMAFDESMREHGEPLICEWCNNTFRVSPKRTMGRRFCCNSCSAYWRAAAKGQSCIAKNCEQCGKQFKSYFSEVHKRKQRFCSDACRITWFNQYSRTEQSGENNPYWNPLASHDEYYGPTWRRARAAARKRDMNSCQSCGATSAELGYIPIVHHIIPFAWFGLEKHAEANQIKNLVCYCRSCHLKAEWKIRAMLKADSRQVVRAKLQRAIDKREKTNQLSLFDLEG